MAEIIRPMSKAELNNLTVNGVAGANLNKPRRQLNAREKFELELHKQEKLAVSKGLPFARHVVREDFDKAIKVQIDRQLREYGSIEKPEELKVPVIDWDKYSDVKNFDIAEEKEVPDSNLSNKNPGLNVKVKTIVYKFKGYGQTYRVMEPGPDAITRAIVTRRKLDNTIDKQLK